MIKQLYIILWLLYPISCFSQQARIGYIQNYSGSSISYTYNSKFITSSNGPVLFNKNTDLYHSKKVKQVEVTVKNGAVIWRLKLDATGAISSTGFRAGGYFVEIEK